MEYLIDSKHSVTNVTILLCLIVFVMLSLLILYNGQFVGIADNSDYSRTMEPLGIEHINNGDAGTRFTWFNRYYGTASSSINLQNTTPTIIIGYLSVIVNNMFNGAIYDIKYLSLLYLFFVSTLLVLYCKCIFRLIDNFTIALVIVIITCYILLTPSYLLMFNSFYQEPTALLFMFALVIASFIIQGRYPNIIYIIALAAPLLLSLVKTQYILSFTIFIMTALFIFVLRGTSIKFYKIAIYLLISILPIVIYSIRTDRNGQLRAFELINRFNAVYNGIAMISKDKEAVFERLKLPKDTIKFVRQHSQNGNELNYVWITDDERYYFYNSSVSLDYSRVNLALLYVSNYEILKTALINTSNAMKDIHIKYLGNYQYNNINKIGRYNYAVSWENNRELLNLIGIIYIVFPIIILIYAILSINNPFAFPLINLSLFILTQYVVAILGDGFYEHSKHLFLAKFAFDISLPLTFCLIYINRHQLSRSK